MARTTENIWKVFFRDSEPWIRAIAHGQEYPLRDGDLLGVSLEDDKKLIDITIENRDGQRISSMPA